MNKVIALPYSHIGLVTILNGVILNKMCQITCTLSVAVFQNISRETQTIEYLKDLFAFFGGLSGMSAVEKIDRFVKEQKSLFPLRDKILSDYERIFNQLPQEQPLPGMLSFLANLKKNGMKVFTTSINPQKTVQEQTQAVAGLGESLTETLYSDPSSEQNKKPHIALTFQQYPEITRIIMLCDAGSEINMAKEEERPQGKQISTVGFIIKLTPDELCQTFKTCFEKANLTFSFQLQKFSEFNRDTFAQDLKRSKPDTRLVYDGEKSLTIGFQPILQSPKEKV